MSVAHGTEKRQGTGLVRMRLATKELLRLEAERRGQSMLDTLDELVPKVAHRASTDRVCRYCGRETKNPHAMHKGHAYDCSLYAAGREAGGR